MATTVAWTMLEAGRYTARYLGKTLDIRRNPDPEDKRRYLALVDGQAWPQPCWHVNQAKGRCIRWARDGAAYVNVPRFDDPFDDLPAADPPEPAPAGPATTALVPYAEETAADADEGWIELPYTVTGVMRVQRADDGISHLRSAVELLREWGESEGRVNLPPTVTV